MDEPGYVLLSFYAKPFGQFPPLRLKRFPLPDGVVALDGVPHDLAAAAAFTLPQLLQAFPRPGSQGKTGYDGTSHVITSSECYYSCTTDFNVLKERLRPIGLLCPPQSEVRYAMIPRASITFLI